MASVSGATGLGNTSLRGFGGMASGIDRDSLIEQMTLGTTTKISNKKKEMTNLQWKQEAYQSVIDKVLDMEDNYFSYSSTTSLIDPNFFSKNQITAIGDSDVTKFISASGKSDMMDYLSVLGVKQRASAATLKSKGKEVAEYISTGITDINKEGTCATSNLEGRYIEFGSWSEADKSFHTAAKFTFPTTYTETVDGKKVTKNIDYTKDLTDPKNREDLKDQLNKALEQSGVKIGNEDISKVISFDITDDGKFQINSTNSNLTIRAYPYSTALTALGFDSSIGAPLNDVSKGISFSDFNSHMGDFAEKSIEKKSMAEYMTGKKISVSYGSQTKEIELIKSGETFNNTDELATAINSRLEKAFGKGIVVADGSSGTLRFKLGDNEKVDPNSTISINSSSAEVRKMLGITQGDSNKVSLNGSLRDNWKKLGFNSETEFDEQMNQGIIINGVTIGEGKITADSTVNELINAINTSDAGVRATFLDSSNQFALIATQTGIGREIDVSGAASTIFGDDPNGSKDGEDAIMEVSYGNGITTEIHSSTDTFNVEGLKITVSGTFGYDKEGNLDSSKAVTFSAKADVDGATERVKKFIEEYNALVSAINTEMTTRPDSDYGPLTDEQKDEMSETSIENWEKKAKEGLLFGDSNLRGLSDELQSMMVSFIRNGADDNERKEIANGLKEIGITVSDDWYDGGQLLFDETKFRAAMTNDPDKVGKLICGNGDGKTGVIGTISNRLGNYATRFSYKHNGSYGSLVEVAGSPKLARSVTNNQIYKQLKQMEEDLAKLKSTLSKEEDRYIQQFTSMENLINQMNSQSSYLSSLSV